MVGTHEQVPPAYSAIKRGGVTAYTAARKGEALELGVRTIEVKAAKLLGLECVTEYAWDVALTVSKGTYIRAIARDLGRAMNCAAHLGGLRRTRSGALDIAQAHQLDEVAESTDIRSLFADPLAALGLPVVTVDTHDAIRISTGASIPGEATGLVAMAHDGALLGVYAGSEGQLKPLAVIPGGVAGGA
jgi:tRNA pseudouridine55 synthase